MAGFDSKSYLQFCCFSFRFSIHLQRDYDVSMFNVNRWRAGQTSKLIEDELAYFTSQEYVDVSTLASAETKELNHIRPEYCNTIEPSISEPSLFY